MAKVAGFNKAYGGLKENEAWQRIYECGKNLMPIKERVLQKKYNKIFNKKTKVIRDNVLQKVNTDRLVPGDVIVIERGEFVPVDGKILEENAIEFEKEFIPENPDFKYDINEKIIYQGMKVKRGKAIIEAVRTGDTTYLGSFVKKADNKRFCEVAFEKAVHRYINIIGIIGLILLFFGAVFSFVRGEGDITERLSIAGYSGLLLFLATVPVGAVLVSIFKLNEQKRIIRKSNLILKKSGTLLKAHKTTVICIDERFLTRNYEKYIQRFYGAGIMIAVISKKGKEEIEEAAKKAGIFEEGVVSVSGNELLNMEDETFYRTICNTVIFYNVEQAVKLKIAEGFNKLNIKTLGIVDGPEDIPMLEYIDIAVCTHHRKRNLEYEFSDATIIGTEMTSLYSLIKGSCMIKNYLNHYIKYYIMFQLPVTLALLVALLANIDLKVFYFQTLTFIIAIIPLLLLLVNRDYSEDKIFELKKRDKAFVIDCLKFGFVGIAIGIFGIAMYMLLSRFGIQAALKISIVTVLLTVTDAGVVMLSRKKFGSKKTAVRREDSIIGSSKSEEEVSEDKIKVKKSAAVRKDKIKEEKVKEPKIKEEKKIKESKVKNKKKSSIEDIRDEIM